MSTRSCLALFCMLVISAPVFAAAPGTLNEIKDESSVTYQLRHPLHMMEATSRDVTYRIELDSTNKGIKSISADVDVMTFNSGNSNRDSHAMEVIDAITYPDAIFSSTQVTQSGDSLSVAGKLTFHGVTKDIVASMVSKWSLHKLEVRGGFAVTLSGFKIERPSLLMIPVNDTLKFSLVAAFSVK